MGVNSLGIDFGVRHTGDTVGDVTLPPWATDKTDFVAKLRWALESPAVSRHLHHWIDLIFGFKSSGEEAEKADNVFYPLCYEGNVDLDKISDLNERYAGEVQMASNRSTRPPRRPSGTQRGCICTCPCGG